MQDTPLYAFFMVVFGVGLILSVILSWFGIHIFFGWIVIGLLVVLFLIALAPATWHAVNQERPNSILWVGGISIGIAVVLKVIGL